MSSDIKKPAGSGTAAPTATAGKSKETIAKPSSPWIVDKTHENLGKGIIITVAPPGKPTK